VSFINDNFNDNSHSKFSDKSDCNIVSCINDNKDKHCEYSGYNLVNVVCDDVESEECNIIPKLCVDYRGHDVKDIKNDSVSFVIDQVVNANDTCNVIGDVFDGHANLCEQSHSHIPIYDIDSCDNAYRLFMFKGINMYGHGVVSDGNLSPLYTDYVSGSRACSGMGLLYNIAHPPHTRFDSCNFQCYNCNVPHLGDFSNALKTVCILMSVHNSFSKFNKFLGYDVSLGDCYDVLRHFS
jgi:hypothetical protein